MRIVGLVIRAKPEHMDSVSAALTALPGVELHARQDSDGKLVLTVEDLPGHPTTDTLTRIQLVENLVCVTLAYEHSDESDCADAGDADPVPAQPDIREAAAG